MKTGTYSSKQFGKISITTEDGKLARLHFGIVAMPTTQYNPEDSIVEQVLLAVDENIISSNLKLKLVGTPFQLKVWAALRDIPMGYAASYKEIAETVGSPNAARAIGTACGANQIAVIIPCHRVIRGDGDIGGYRWGLDIKNKLLTRENIAIK